MLELSHKEIKAATIIIVNKIMVNTLETTEKNKIFSRETIFKKKNHMENLELKNIVSEIFFFFRKIFKNSLHGLNQRTEMIEERVSKLERRANEII